MNHVSIEKGIKNGQPLSIRMSWQFLSVLLAAFALMVTVGSSVRSSDLAYVETGLEAQRERIARNEAAINALEGKLGRRLDTLQSSIDEVNRHLRDRGAP